MTICVKINGKKRRLCGDELDRILILQNRTITAPIGGDDVDYGEAFDDLSDDTPCMIKTRPVGTTFFGGVTNTEETIDIEFYIRFEEGISTETWIEFEGDRYRILHVEDLDKRHEWLKLVCTERGDKGNAVNAA